MPFRDSIPMRLRRAYLAIHRTAQRRFAEFGVTTDQYVLLSLLADEDDITQKDLGARMCSDANTIAAMVSLLESRGLLLRERCELDGRARRIHLSAEGRRLQKKLIAHANALHDLMDNAVDADERALLFECLEKISNAMIEEAEVTIE